MLVPWLELGLADPPTSTSTSKNMLLALDSIHMVGELVGELIDLSTATWKHSSSPLELAVTAIVPRRCGALFG